MGIGTLRTFRSFSSVDDAPDRIGAADRVVVFELHGSLVELGGWPYVILCSSSDNMFKNPRIVPCCVESSR